MRTIRLKKQVADATVVWDQSGFNPNQCNSQANLQTPEIQFVQHKKTVANLIQKIQRRKLRISVFGSGYVGLPTAALFADAGFRVTALDVKPEIIAPINNGDCPKNEPGLRELISRNVKARRLKVSLYSLNALKRVDAVLVCVQTPMQPNKKPDLSFLVRAIEDIGKSMKRGLLIVICSTVPPGTILKILKPTLETQSGLEAESEFYIAYAPERIAPGKALKEFVENSRLIGGIGTDSTKITAELFKIVCKNVNETDVATAEVAKLAENTFRDVNIAYANQLAIICEQLGVDVMKVIGLANTHPRVNIHMPGPGVGGPCLPKDPYFLLDSLAETNLDLITMARLVNENMPKHLLKLVAEALRIVDKHTKDSRIAVLGVAYKGDVDDSRFSPSEPLVSELLRQGAVVVVYDPICNETFGGEKANSLDEAVKNVDCIVLMTDHSVFRKLDLHEIRASVNDNPVIVDGRRILADCEAENNGFFYYGVGLGKKTTKQKSHGSQPFLHFTAINMGVTPQKKASLSLK